MVPEAWWEAVQAIRKPRYKHRPRLDAATMPCQGCCTAGCAAGHEGGQRPASRRCGETAIAPRRYRRYTCTGWKQNRDCDMHYLRADVIEEAVYRVLLEEVLLPENLLKILKDAAYDETRQALEHDAQRFEASLVDVEQVLRRLVDAVERSGYSASLGERLAEREKERSRYGSSWRRCGAGWIGQKPKSRWPWLRITAPMLGKSWHRGRWTTCGRCCARSWSALR